MNAQLCAILAMRIFQSDMLLYGYVMIAEYYQRFQMSIN